jgi:hypothetical protein
MIPPKEITMSDRYLKPFENPRKPHLVTLGKGGVPGEVADLRDDVSDAFARLAAEVDAGELGLAPVADLAELALVDAAGVDEGNIIYVNSVDDLYVLDKSGSHTPDGLTIIAAVGGGYWVARIVGRWDDLQGDIAEGVGGAAWTYEAFRDTPFKMFFSRHNQDDELNLRYQFSHEWDYTTDIFPHLHILPMADPAAPESIRFSGAYAWTRPFNAAIPAVAGWTTFQIDVAVPPGSVYVQRIAPIGAVTPPAWVRESSLFLWHVKREGTNVADTYDTDKDHGLGSANLGLLSADIHFQHNKHATTTAIPTEG